MNVGLAHRVWSFCRVRRDEGLLPILSAELLGSGKLIAAGLLPLVAFRAQMDIVQSDVGLARWQCRLLKSTLLPPGLKFTFMGPANLLFGSLTFSTETGVALQA